VKEEKHECTDKCEKKDGKCTKMESDHAKMSCGSHGDNHKSETQKGKSCCEKDGDNAKCEKEGKDANRFVALYDQMGIERGTFFINKTKSMGGYALFDGKGRNRLVAGLKPDGIGYFIAVDSTGAIQWKAP
jgi:hypothetical protein